MATSNETATYIGDLPTSPTVPVDATAGGRSRGGAEIRKTKQIMKASFPNVTGAVTATHTELNILDGVTATTAELNALDGITFSTDGTLAGNSDTDIPTEQAVKTYADSLTEQANTAVATTSGTAVDLSTSIPSGTSEITLVFDSVGVSDVNSHWLIQIGSSSYSTSGYVSTGVSLKDPFTAPASSTNGFLIYYMTSNNKISGTATLRHMGSNAWVLSFVGASSGGTLRLSSGDITLGGELDRVRLTTAGGVQTFDEGAIRVFYR